MKTAKFSQFYNKLLITDHKCYMNENYQVFAKTKRKFN